jgi:hypothetical protein
MSSVRGWFLVYSGFFGLKGLEKDEKGRLKADRLRNEVTSSLERRERAH